MMASSEKERRRYVELYHASGLTPVMFCKQHSIKVKTFYGWLKRYPCPLRETSKLSPSRESSSFSEEAFIPLKITDFNPEQEVTPERDSIKFPSGSTMKPLLTLCFKTPHFCLDVSLDLDQHFSEFQLMLQAFQELS